MVHRGGLSCCRTELVRHCHFTGKAPPPSSGPLPEAADSSLVTDENQTKRVKTHGTGAIAPGDCEVVLAQFTKAGIALDTLAAQLQDEGAKSFVKSWDELMAVIASKSAALAKAS
jgi:hypothetical protein